MADLEQAQEAPSLTVNDLVVLAQVVQASASRGAIEASEMTTVGAVYTKLVAFLEASGAVTKPQQTTEE